MSRARLSLTNNGPHVRKSSHFAVYDNVSPAMSLADYPAKFPGQFTVDASRSVSHPATSASIGIAARRYDLTVVGPNRFLRHFTGDSAAPRATAEVAARYYVGGSPSPRLVLDLVNGGRDAVTFTVAPNHYATGRARTFRVPAHGSVTQSFQSFVSDGWYDVTVTVSGDRSWSRRYTGHLEDGNPSVTG